MSNVRREVSAKPARLEHLDACGLPVLGLLSVLIWFSRFAPPSSRPAIALNPGLAGSSTTPTPWNEEYGCEDSKKRGREGVGVGGRYEGQHKLHQGCCEIRRLGNEDGGEWGKGGKGGGRKRGRREGLM
eukprot:756732-Hanusia_phi.AAC.10